MSEDLDQAEGARDVSDEIARKLAFEEVDRIIEGVVEEYAKQEVGVRYDALTRAAGYIRTKVAAAK